MPRPVFSSGHIGTSFSPVVYHLSRGQRYAASILPAYSPALWLPSPSPPSSPSPSPQTDRLPWHRQVHAGADPQAHRPGIALDQKNARKPGPSNTFAKLSGIFSLFQPPFFFLVTFSLSSHLFSLWSPFPSPVTFFLPHIQFCPMAFFNHTLSCAFLLHVPPT